MRKTKLGFITAAMLVVSTAAWAASPHFVGDPTLKPDTYTTVKVCWKEAGLGDNQNVKYTASADTTVTYVCKNKGGQCPDAANKKTVQGPISTTGSFSSDKNGSITACLSLKAPTASDFVCPSGQAKTLSEVVFSGLKVKDDTNGVESSSVPSAIAATPFTCPGS